MFMRALPRTGHELNGISQTSPLHWGLLLGANVDAGALLGVRGTLMPPHCFGGWCAGRPLLGALL